MAFESKYKPQGEMCPVCRRQFTDGRKIDIPAYTGHGSIMCKDCFRRLYKNRQQGRTAAVTDDPNSKSIRPAQILERPRFMKGSEPAGGYEFVMPNLTHFHMIKDAAVWALVVIISKLAVKFLTPDETPFSWSLSGSIMGLVFAAVSLLLAFCALRDLIKGIALGMGHSRRIILLCTALVMLVLTYIELPEFLLKLLHK